MTRFHPALLLAIAAFLARLIVYQGTLVIGTDSGQFLYMADRLFDGHIQLALQGTYHPLYPYLISVLKLSGMSSADSGCWVSMVLGSAAVLPLFYVVESIFGRPAAFLTSLLYAFHRDTVLIQGDVMTEGTFTFFFLGSVALCWRLMEHPAVGLAVVGGLFATSAYLTRPEGILAMVLLVAWPIGWGLIRRGSWSLRAASTAAALAVMVVAACPYLLWIRAETGHWALSAKGSVLSLTQGTAAPTQLLPPAAPVGGEPATGVSPRETAKREKSAPGTMGKGVRIVTRLLFPVVLPFLLLGLFSIPRGAGAGLLFYFSVPAAYLAGLGVASRSMQELNYRYLLPSLAMLGVLIALGLIRAIQWLSRTWPTRNWALVSGALLLVVCVLPSIKVLNLQRSEEAGLVEAARWVRARTPSPLRICSTSSKTAYLCGGRWLRFAVNWSDHLWCLEHRPADYYIYDDRDVARGLPPYLEKLSGTGKVEAAVVFPQHPRPGVLTYYVHPLR